jgi:hypothetical protein
MRMALGGRSSNILEGRKIRMPMLPGVSRRTLLASLGATTAVACTGGLPTVRTTEVAALDDLLRSFFTRVSDARALGAAYVMTHPAEAGAVLRLRRSLLEGRVPRPVTALRQRLAADIADDFTAGRVVVLEGFVMARTEARLCACAVPV